MPRTMSEHQYEMMASLTEAALCIHSTLRSLATDTDEQRIHVIGRVKEQFDNPHVAAALAAFNDACAAALPTLDLRLEDNQ